MSRYAKTVAAFLGSVATWGATAVADNAVTPVEWFGLLAAVAAVIAVWGVSNSPPSAKTADDKSRFHLRLDDEGGYSDILLLVVGLLLGILLYAVFR